MQKPPECQGCPIVHLSTSFSVPDGKGMSGVTIIGEGLGEEEAKDGLPFRPKAASGSKLEECFRLAEGDLLTPVRRDMFTLWNMIACQPPYGNRLEGMFYEQGAIEHCKVHFNKVVTGNNNIILALGNIPLRYLTSASGRAHEKQSITYLRGYVFKGKYGLVIPSLHPSYIKRGNPNYTPLLVQDIKKVLLLAEGNYTHRWSNGYKEPDYNIHPSLSDVASFYHHVQANSRLVLTYDIETPETGSIEEDERDELESGEILTVQFSYQKGMAINIPYKYDYIPWIEKLFLLPNTKANQNTWIFDNPRLEAKGIKINGRIHDLMWMWKHYSPNLPRNLQSIASWFDFPFPWKHLYQSKFEWYGCCDVDADQYIVHALPALMKARGVWKGYIDQVYGMWPILTKASQVGIPVDDTARLALLDKMKAKSKGLWDGMQKVVPVECKNVQPRRGKVSDGTLDYGYLREPTAIKQLRERYQTMSRELQGSGKVIKSFAKLAWEKLGLAELDFIIDGKTVTRWCRYEEFNPSKEQLSTYIKWKRKTLEISDIEEERELADFYVVPTKLETNKQTGVRVEKETTGRKELEEVYYETGDEVLEAALSYRSTETTINNFIPNWEPREDGRVHTHFGFKAASGQLDSRRPNVLNCSKHSENGQEFRRIVVAPPGYIFLEADYRSFHIATMGYAANDKDYIRFSQIDPHSIFTSFIMPKDWGPPVDMKWRDDDIRARCKEIKARCKLAKENDPLHGVDLRQQVAKPVVLGNQLGLGPLKLHRQNRRYITTTAYAKELQLGLAGRFPKVELTKTAIMELADRQKYLMTDFGFIQWFYEVFAWRYSKYRREFYRTNGMQAEQALAFQVQSPAFSILKWNVLEAERLGYCESYGFVNSIHDSVMFLFERVRLDQFLRDVYPLLVRPCSVLVNEATGPKGLKVGVDVSIGRNWQAWNERDNPEGMRDIRV